MIKYKTLYILKKPRGSNTLLIKTFYRLIKYMIKYYVNQNFID